MRMILNALILDAILLLVILLIYAAVPVPW